jgi:hypothetical protein
LSREKTAPKLYRMCNNKKSGNNRARHRLYGQFPKVEKNF